MNFEEKKLFLVNIKDRKEILFGKFNNTITRESKIEAWNAIHETLKLQNVQLAVQKDACYFRDSVWPNLKRYTLEKRDRRNRTGAEGGSKATFNDVDHIVLDILGVDSPQAVGLDVLETWQQNENCPPSSADVSQSDSRLKRKSCQPLQPLPETVGTKRIRTADAFTEEFREKKLEKLNLEIENLQLRNQLLRQLLNDSHRIVCVDDISLRQL